MVLKVNAYQGHFLGVEAMIATNGDTLVTYLDLLVFHGFKVVAVARPFAQLVFIYTLTEVSWRPHVDRSRVFAQIT